jgi:YD repeat-containing protein
VNFGTNRSDDLFATGGTSPASTWPPSAPPSVLSSIGLVSAVTYNTRGMVDASYEPNGTDATPTARATKFFYDALGRRYAVIENYDTTVETPQVLWDSGHDRWMAAYGIYASTPDVNRVTTFVYDGNGNVVKQAAHLPSGGASEIQVTQYTYGSSVGSVGTDTESLVANTGLLVEVAYPQESGTFAGEPGTTDAYKVKYSHNRLGELRAVVDQNGTKHTYTRDLSGRALNDTAYIPSGSPIDTRVRQIAAAYDSFGRLSTVKSYNATPSVVNAVEFLYRPLWQDEAVFQDHDGDITRTTGTPPAPTGNTAVVRYAYGDAQVAAGTAGSNFSRVTSLTYPDGTVLNYRYGTSGTADERISRAAALDFGTTDPIVSYTRVGLDMFAQVYYAGANVQLDRTFDQTGQRGWPGHTSQTAGVYPGWDRYGRVVIQPWVDGTLDRATGTSLPTRP